MNSSSARHREGGEPSKTLSTRISRLSVISAVAGVNAIDCRHRLPWQTRCVSGEADAEDDPCEVDADPRLARDVWPSLSEESDEVGEVPACFLAPCQEIRCSRSAAIKASRLPVAVAGRSHVNR